jgi:hypothetical protein
VKNVEVVHESDIGVVKPQEDLPCELCEQLVIHLRDVLVANTTEAEFEEVLKGLCKQTGSFKDEVSTPKLAMKSNNSLCVHPLSVVIETE